MKKRNKQSTIPSALAKKRHERRANIKNTNRKLTRQSKRQEQKRKHRDNNEQKQ